MFNNFFFFENLAVYEMMWKNMVELGRPQVTIWRMRIACWIPKATNAHSVHNTLCFYTATMVARPRLDVRLYVKGGSNMTGTDLCVNKPHCAAAVRP